MTCTPELLLDAAKAVCGLAKDEAMHRSAANRAYYASYHCCRLYHASLSHVGAVAGKGSHEQLISQLMSPSPKLTKNGRARSIAIGKYLRHLCTYRVKADYFIDESFEANWMDDAMATATAIFDGVKAKSGLI